jgi:hypothetical protein
MESGRTQISDLTEDAARVGREIRAVETFVREPGEAYRRPSFTRAVTQPSGAVSLVDYAEGGIQLCADGTGRITGIPEAVWGFLGQRLSRPAAVDRVACGLAGRSRSRRELRDICSRIAELIDRFGEADIVLEATLRETLPREALGLDGGGQEGDSGPLGPGRGRRRAACSERATIGFGRRHSGFCPIRRKSGIV